MGRALRRPRRDLVRGAGQLRRPRRAAPGARRVAADVAAGEYVWTLADGAADGAARGGRLPAGRRDPVRRVHGVAADRGRRRGAQPADLGALRPALHAPVAAAAARTCGTSSGSTTTCASSTSCSTAPRRPLRRRHAPRPVRARPRHDPVAPRAGVPVRLTARPQGTRPDRAGAVAHTWRMPIAAVPGRSSSHDRPRVMAAAADLRRVGRGHLGRRDRARRTRPTCSPSGCTWAAPSAGSSCWRSPPTCPRSRSPRAPRSRATSR